MANDFPDTLLRQGQLDDPFGGQLANAGGSLVRAFIDAQIREAHRQILDDQWSPFRFVRAKAFDDGVAGDCFVEDLNGVDGSYTLRRVNAVTYDADTTPFFGLLLEPVSAGNVAKFALIGIGIEPNVTGLLAGATGDLTFDTTTARLRLQLPGEPVVGTLNVAGRVRLYGRAEG